VLRASTITFPRRSQAQLNTAFQAMTFSGKTILLEKRGYKKLRHKPVSDSAIVDICYFTFAG